MKTLHSIAPQIPENVLDMGTGLCFHFPEPSDLRLAVVNGELRYSFGGSPPFATPSDQTYWTTEGERAPRQYRERAEHLIRQG